MIWQLGENLSHKEVYWNCVYQKAQADPDKQRPD